MQAGGYLVTDPQAVTGKACNCLAYEHILKPKNGFHASMNPFFRSSE
jgi:hypothetical protein